MKLRTIAVTVLLVLAIATMVYAMPPSPDDFCDGHDGIASFYLEIIGWFHGAPITTGWISCADGLYVDW